MILRGKIVEYWLLPLGVVGVFLALSGNASAAEWRIGASITERFNYDSNIRLSTGSKQEVWGLSTLPNISLEGKSPRLDLSVTADLEYTFFEGADDLDSFDQRGGANLGYSWQRARVNLSGSIVHATTRTTELEDTGLVFSDAERLIFSGGGAWSYLVSQRDRFGIRGNASRSVADTNAIQDYTSYGGGLFWSRQVTEKDTLELSGSYSRYIRTSGLDLESDAASGKLSYDHMFSPRFKVSIHGGGSYVMTNEKVFNGVTIVSRDQNSAGILAGATVTYLIPRGDLSASYQRSQDASGAGRLQKRDTVRLSTKYNATPDISLDVVGTFIGQESVDSGVDDRRTYISAEPGVNWQFYRNLYFRMSYRFKTQKFENADDWAVSRGAHASLAWRMPATNLVAGN